jgi:hypothetical protein
VLHYHFFVRLRCDLVCLYHLYGSTSIGNVLIVTGVLGVIEDSLIGTFERNEQTDAKTAEDTTANILKVVEITTELTTVRSR